MAREGEKVFGAEGHALERAAEPVVLEFVVDVLARLTATPVSGEARAL